MADRVTLRLTIDFPGFYLDLDDIDNADEEEEEIEAMMHLASDSVACVFQGYDGDSPGQVLRTLEGTITGFGWVRRG